MHGTARQRGRSHIRTNLEIEVLAGHSLGLALLLLECLRAPHPGSVHFLAAGRAVLGALGRAPLARAKLPPHLNGEPRTFKHTTYIFFFAP
jgi:hypothetical protein